MIFHQLPSNSINLQSQFMCVSYNDDTGTIYGFEFKLVEEFDDGDEEGDSFTGTCSCGA